ncbi:MAG: hypothetical protein HFI96_01005 [Lachnospiraceae bacterium]|jgi:hypothetical protein|nr:hypothetical protein [Lachnospiraceae bacterium]
MKEIVMNKNRDKEIFYTLMAFLVTFLLSFWGIYGFEIPWSGDSTFTIANGMYFAGYNWNSLLKYHAYYGWGYMIFYTPIIKLVKNPYVLYRFFLIGNYCLYAFSSMMVYKIIRQISDVSERKALIFSVLSIIWMPTFVQKDFVINESALLFWTVLVVFLFVRQKKIRKYKTVYSIFVGCILAYGYSIHSRSIVFMIAFILVLVLERFLFSIKRFRFGFFFAGFFLTLMIMSQMSRYMQNSLWEGYIASALPNTMGTTVGKLRFFSYLFDGKKITEFFKILLTNLVTYIYITGGLWAFCLVSAISSIIYIMRNRKKKIDVDIFSLSLLGLLSFLAMVFVISLSYVGILEEGQYSYKYLFYYRYASHYGCILWIMFFCYYERNNRRSNRGVWMVSSILLFLSAFWMCTFLVNDIQPVRYNLNKTTLFNIFKWVSDLIGENELNDVTFLLCTKFLILLGFIFCILLEKNFFKYACLLFGILSVTSYLYINGIVSDIVQKEKQRIDETVEYVQFSSKLNWDKYKIYFGGEGTYSCALRYGLFNVDMEYLIDLRDIELKNALCFTDNLENIETSDYYCIEMGENEFIVTGDFEIYNELSRDYYNR